MKGRLTAALAAGALLAGAGTAVAAFVTEAGSPYTVGNDPLSLTTGDFNGDGRPDVVTVNGSSSDLSVFLRQPGGGFAQAPGSPIAVGSGPNLAAVADFNGDGKLDLAVSAFNFGQVAVLLGQGDGTFAQEGGLLAPAGGLTAITTGDFNGDGRPDLAVSSRSNGQVITLLRNSANNGFTQSSSFALNGPEQLAAADFNGDNRTDIAALDDGGNLTVYLNTAAAGFQPDPGGAVAIGPTPGGLAVADFNGDGRPDIAADSFGSATVSILLRNATGGFTALTPIAVTTGPVGVATGDVDGDGRPDVAVAANGGAVEVLHNTAAGFTRETIPLPGDNNGIAIADFDGNGRRDLALSTFGTPGTDPNADTFRVLLNPSPAAPPPTPTPVPTATPTPTPPPVAGQSVNVARVSGTVKIKRRGSKAFVTLPAGAQIPVGSTIDTRKGRVAITAAQGKGRTATAQFYDGLFKLAQTGGAKPLTTLTLTEALSCPRRGSASAAAKKKKSRKLWGDGSGAFSTRGQYSAATVRGTRWLVQDTCDATLTKVAKGVVSVRDLVKRKTVIVRAPHSYTARRRH